MTTQLAPAPPQDGLDLDGLATLAEKATPGPYEYEAYGDGHLVNSAEGYIVVDYSLADEPPDREPAARYFAALDPTTVLRLIAAARLGEAWERAERALPEDWDLKLSGGGTRPDLYTATASYCYSLRHYRENVGPARFAPFEMAHDADPTAALQALATALSEAPE